MKLWQVANNYGIMRIVKNKLVVLMSSIFNDI
jgi:hypothetical protein